MSEKNIILVLIYLIDIVLEVKICEINVRVYNFKCYNVVIIGVIGVLDRGFRFNENFKIVIDI